MVCVCVCVCVFFFLLPLWHVERLQFVLLRNRAASRYTLWRYIPVFIKAVVYITIF